MARYQLLRAHFLGTHHFLAGAIVSWNGPAGRYMDPVDDEGRAAKVVAEQKQRTQSGRAARAARVPHRATANAAHSPASAPGEKPLWSGFRAVPKQEQEQGKPPMVATALAGRVAEDD